MRSGLSLTLSPGIKGDRKSTWRWKKRGPMSRLYHYDLLCARTFSHLAQENFVRVLTQTAKKRDPRLTEVSTVNELMEEYKTPESTRGLATLMLASGDFGRPIIASPGIPADRVKLLREAFAKTLRDPELLDEAKETAGNRPDGR